MSLLTIRSGRWNAFVVAGDLVLLLLLLRVFS